MKKVKLLIGFLFVGLGLLISSSFGSYFDIQLVSTTLNDLQDSFDNDDYSKSYSYLFRSDLYADGNGYGYLGYGLYYNKNLVVNRLSNNCVLHTLFNNSVIQLDLFTGGCRGSSPAVPYNIYSYSTWSNRVKLMLGDGTNNGKLFISYDNGSDSLTYNSTYGFGNGFFDSSDYSVQYSNDWLNGMKILYYTSGSNNLNSIDFVGPVTSSPAVLSWELFGNNTQTLTNYGYIVDTSYTKGKVFGGLGMGYSFIHYVPNSSGTVSWNTFGFVTVTDEVDTWLKSLGSINVVSGDPDNSLHFNGIGVFRKNSYSSNGNDGVILISKNPKNSKQLLYQEFSCQSMNIRCLMDGGTWCPDYLNSTRSGNFSCVVLSQGVLSKNGSLEILPFNDFKTSVSINDSPLLKYFLTSDGRLGNVYSSGNQLCFGEFNINNSYCYDKLSSSDSIKDNYLEGNYGTTPITTGVVNKTVEDYCINDPLFAIQHPDLCNGISPSDTVIIDGHCFKDTNVCYFPEGSGTLLCGTKLIPCNFTGDVYEDEDGNYYYINTGDNNSFRLNPLAGEINFTTGFLDSGGLLSGNYFDSFFDGHWLASCPFPYVDTFSNITNFKIAGFYPFMPVACFISAFMQGSNIHYFDAAGVFTGSIDQSLLYGTSRNHEILFRFFDVLLSFGIFLILSYLVHLFKK